METGMRGDHTFIHDGCFGAIAAGDDSSTEGSATPADGSFRRDYNHADHRFGYLFNSILPVREFNEENPR